MMQMSIDYMALRLVEIGMTLMCLFCLFLSCFYVTLSCFFHDSDMFLCFYGISSRCGNIKFYGEIKEVIDCPFSFIYGGFQHLKHFLIVNHYVDFKWRGMSHHLPLEVVNDRGSKVWTKNFKRTIIQRKFL